MAVMMGKLYAALREANAPELAAREAAEEAAEFRNSLADIKAEFSKRIAPIERDLAILKWMVGFNLAMTVAIVVRLFLMH
jgi:hypothetical protein